MFLILAHSTDETAYRVQEALRKRHGVAAARLLTIEELTCATVWTHSHAKRQIHTNLCLSDGTQLSSKNIAAVFNRLRYVTMPQFTTAKIVDREYAVMEMHALLLSWLESLSCTVVNAPDTRGLSGAERSLAGWLQLAGEAGLPTRGLHFTTNARRFPNSEYEPHLPSSVNHNDATTHALRAVSRLTLGGSPAIFLEPIEAAQQQQRALVIGEKVCGNISPRLKDGCLRLARLGNYNLLECFFARSIVTEHMLDKETCGQVLCGATHFPNISVVAEIEMIADLLQQPRLTPRTNEESSAL